MGGWNILSQKVSSGSAYVGNIQSRSQNLLRSLKPDVIWSASLLELILLYTSLWMLQASRSDVRFADISANGLRHLLSIYCPVVDHGCREVAK